jgi:hypothetical protein
MLIAFAVVLLAINIDIFMKKSVSFYSIYLQYVIVRILKI